MKNSSTLFGGILIFAFACSPKTTSINNMPTTFYQEEIKLWQKSRVAEVTSSEGWLSLAGLFWLKEGENTFGADDRNKINFPKTAPSNIGNFTLKEKEVLMTIKEDIPVIINNENIKNIVLVADIDGQPTLSKLDALSWYLIQREGRFAIRLRNAESPDIKKFKGITNFSIDQSWQIPANLMPAKDQKTVQLINVLDMDVTMKLEGVLVFDINGEKYELEAMDGGEDYYFVIFADETTGEETYGAGRYLYVPRVDDKGKTLIDFNKAHNPPCAFTDFATCPLPSLKNRLPIKVNAGEKEYHK